MAATWSRHREGDLTLDDHVQLVATLRAAYPRYADKFTGRRSWFGARPEVRVLARDGDQVAAHAGVIRRFIEVEDGNGARTERLVGIVGLVAVHPDRAGAGLGRTLMEHTADLLHEMRVPFGILLCGDDVRGFYRACGWQARPGTSWTLAFDPWDPEVHHHPVPVMVLPVAGDLDKWPSGDLHWHCQQV